MNIEKSKIAEIREHIISSHADQLPWPDSMKIDAPGFSHGVEVKCCSKMWEFRREGRLVNAALDSYDDVRNQYIFDVRDAIFNQWSPKLCVNPITDMEL